MSSPPQTRRPSGDWGWGPGELRCRRARGLSQFGVCQSACWQRWGSKSEKADGLQQEGEVGSRNPEGPGGIGALPSPEVLGPHTSWPPGPRQPECKARCLGPQGASALFDMIEYYESATHLNISFNKHIGTRGWQAAAHMMRKVGAPRLSPGAWCRGPLGESAQRQGVPCLRPTLAPILPSSIFPSSFTCLYPVPERWLWSPPIPSCPGRVPHRSLGAPLQDSEPGRPSQTRWPRQRDRTAPQLAGMWAGRSLGTGRAGASLSQPRPCPTRRAAYSTWTPGTRPCWTTRRPSWPAPCAFAAAWRCCIWRTPACRGDPSCCWVSSGTRGG